VRAILFVADDVLVPEHSPEHWQWAWRPQGPLLPERNLRAAIHRGLHEWDRRRWEGVTGAQPPVGAAEHREFLRRMLAEIAGHRLPDAETEAVVERFLKGPFPRAPYPDVAPALAALRAEGWKLAAFGDRPGPATTELLKRSGLAGSVDVVVGAAPEAPWPPAREAFRSAVASLGAKPKEAVCVGRLYWSDVRASQRAGLTGVLLDRPEWWPRVAERRIRTLAELPAALRAPAPAAPADSGEPSPGAPAEPPGPT
jgi:FMN phosphatase YigB (HAD superfamily)